MYCPNCGKKVEDGSKFCYNCGVELKTSDALGKTDQPQPAEKIIQSEVNMSQPVSGSVADNGKKPGPIKNAIDIIIGIVILVLLLGSITGRFDGIVARLTGGRLADNTTKVAVDSSGIYHRAAETESPKSTAASSSAQNSAQSTAGKVKEDTYSYAYGLVFDRLGDDEWGSYFLWDLNDDGIYELVIGHGSYGSDYINDFYTMDDDGNALKVGQLEAEQTFLTTPDGNGIYAARELKNYERVYRITMTGNTLISNVYIDRPLEEDEQYYSIINTDDVIETANIKDRSLLSRYGRVKAFGKSKK